MEGPHGHGRAMAAALALIFLFTMSTSNYFLSSTETGSECLKILQDKKEQSFWDQPAVSRRRLSGPGSSPPICRSRCGGCIPCRPIHVSIQPGQSIPLEYYPEAWRCKCRNKLFIP
ncbi:EPIDERMAL PATTERNING FACTOR-like protein 4 [Platanthera guangdongensis]|uniref:Epidermal patterning factor-like protein n=1 Tax=Platanthera guangdongensis TaxID=2320717 RepID=A0ABR2MIU1_9ASPA